jgi:sigma-B regulation protein RsbU (phosphoserine phosphatase)
MSTVEVDSCHLLVLEVPVDEDILDFVERRTSIAMELVSYSPVEHESEFQLAYTLFSNRQDFLAIPWVHLIKPVNWATGESRDSRAIFLSVPLWVLLNQLFAQAAGWVMFILLGLLTAFIAVELVSLIIGAAIARDITRSVGNIYQAVENIQQGKFDFRVPTRRKDQLDAMAESFNEMSGSIIRLMDEVSRRELLEKELEIAREVQNLLFPSRMPGTRGLQVAASCTPARRVSGDYYDFLDYEGERLDIVVGDISGKGISAALLMASMQATIRQGLGRGDGTLRPTDRMVRVIEEVNRQLYRRSSPESYSTLVLGHYDASDAKLYYCNAGHHPPLVFSNGGIQQLTVGGTVVGLFEKWQYQGAETQLAKGDLVVIFTDGVVEAEKEDGEQFGTDRLKEVVQTNTFLTAEDIQALILEQVFDWTGDAEQADDMTVVCMKVT